MTNRSRNVAKLVARLNPKNARLDMGFGGGPSEDSPDMVAGAIGWAGVQHPGLQLAIAVFCLKWWPSVGEGPQRRRETGGFVVERGMRRERGGGLSQFAYQEVSFRAVAAQVLPQTTVRQAIDRTLETWLSRKLRSGAFPMPPGLLERINHRPGFWRTFYDTVMDEFLNPARCTHCLGHGQVLKVKKAQGGHAASSKRVDCPTCEGRGLVDRSSNRRARAVGINAQDFHRYLKPPYLWMLNALRHLEYAAARKINRALDEGRIRLPPG
jgi:hypothetical protein